MSDYLLLAIFVVVLLNYLQDNRLAIKLSRFAQRKWKFLIFWAAQRKAERANQK
jgi:hypothetical protein